MKQSQSNTSSCILSIIIPCFNEQDTIERIYKEIKKALKRSIPFEIIFVDDGSSDNSLDIIKKIALDDKRIKYISLRSNHGQQKAIYAGLLHAKGQASIVIDCDLQDPPVLIPEMINEWQRGEKIVLPVRQSRQDKWFKKLSAIIFYAILNIGRKTKLNPDIGEFYLIDSSVQNRLLSRLREPLFLRGSVQHFSATKSYLPYNRDKRAAGKSGFNFLKMLRLAISAFAINKPITRQPTPEISISCSNLYAEYNIAIIGAGFLGLTTAYYLSRLGYNVSLYEKDSDIGGLLSSELIYGQKIDRHYHHIFKKDSDFLSLLADLNLHHQLHFYHSRVAMLCDNQLFAYNNLFNFVTLPGLKLSGKWQMAMGLWRASKKVTFRCDLTSRQYIIKYLGSSAWKHFWQPFFVAKFGLFSNNISAAWFQARLHNRSGSRSLGGEMLGYPNGGFETVIASLKKEIIKRGGHIYTSAEVSSITKAKEKFCFKLSSLSPFSSDLSPQFDFCISTLPPQMTSNIFNPYSSPEIDYLGFVGVTVMLNQPLSRYYWVNVMDKKAPFGVIVEQNNLFKTCGQNLLYLGKYCTRDSNFYQSDDKMIKKIAGKWLEQIKPGIGDQIIEMRVTREPYAQPVVTTDYNCPPHVCNVNNFFTSSMAHIFPTDRSLNEAVKEAKKLTTKITSGS